ncbi:MAG: tRNA pseudouridine(38-40) synthase TruA [Gammaproteobacteria bacterium]|nr:tRNA pseudouridine(38-40) synthase TruA [Gammaproteobacteria bacterium]
MRIALGVEYDGADFLGWQRQSRGRTVQGCVETAVARVADHAVHVVCAGRTDTGVHATAQVIHFDTDALRNPGNWVRGANSHLPADARIQWAMQTGDDFHARFSARRRHYRYVIHNGTAASALLRQRVCQERLPLDDGLMQAAAQHLLGEHDFTSLRAAACQAKSPVRTVYRLDLSRSGEWVYIDIVANAFLHHMVRCIAGMLISVGRGEQAPDWVREVLDARDRTQAGVNAPPGGLYLVGVEYVGELALPRASWLPVYG